MAYRKTRRSKETLARMQAGKDAARMARQAPEGAGLNAMLGTESLEDGFYYYEDPRSPDVYGIIHRLNGMTWRIGESDPFKDSDWVDGVSFSPVPVPNTDHTVMKNGN